MYTRSLYEAPVARLEEIAKDLAESGKRVRVLWQEPDALSFVARGREYRSEFHINPSDEIMYMIRGEMKLHIRTPRARKRSSPSPRAGSTSRPAGCPIRRASRPTPSR